MLEIGQREMVMNDRQAITVCGTILLIVAIAMAAAGFGCAKVNDSYWKAMEACASAGGSFVPARGANGAEALCLRRGETAR